MSVGLPAQRHYLGTGPLDSRTWFETLEEAKNNIPGDRRFKGQKFTVRGNEGEKPVEYWFIEDFVPGSDGQYVACPKCNSEVPPADETEGCDVCMTCGLLAESLFL